MLNEYLHITELADQRGLYTEADDLDSMMRMAQAMPVGMTVLQYLYDLYRRMTSLELKLSQVMESMPGGNTQAPLSLQQQTGVEMHTQLGNPPTTTADLSGASHNFEITQ